MPRTELYCLNISVWFLRYHMYNKHTTPLTKYSSFYTVPTFKVLGDLEINEPRSNIAIQVQNHGLKQYSYIEINAFKHSQDYDWSQEPRCGLTKAFRR